MTTAHPALANFENVIVVVFFLIAIVSWIGNIFKHMKQLPPPKPGQPGQAPTVKTLIEQFLEAAREEMAKKDPDAFPTPKPKQANPPQRRAPPPSPSHPNPQQAWQDQVRTPQPAPTSPVKRTAPSQKREKSTGRKNSATQRSRQTTQSPLSTASSSAAARSSGLGADLSSSSSQRSKDETLGRRKTPADHLRQLLQQQNGVYNAILMNEVLSKPVALRQENHFDK